MYTVEYTQFALEGLINLKKTEPGAIEECKRLLERLKHENFGLKLENKFGRDLSKYRKIYFHNRRYRIIYKKEYDLIIVCGVGEREDLKIYKDIYEKFEKD
jgi:hypothetical protein